MLIQTQSPSLRPLTTAHLAQTMTLMGLNAVELRQKIEAALATNPALELVDEYVCPTCHKPLSRQQLCPVCSRPDMNTPEAPIVYVSPREDFYQYNSSQTTSREDIPTEEFTPYEENLPQYVLRQISLELAKQDHNIAAHILTSLDEDGLLRTPIQRVLKLIQHADPLGVGSSSPQEALLVQLEALGEVNHVPPRAKDAIEIGLNFLSKHQYAELSRVLGISIEQAQAIAKFISENLNPYPARAHWGEIYNPQQENREAFTIPDVIISRLDEAPETPLVVEIISPLSGKIRVNPLFRAALPSAPEDKHAQWEKHIEQAMLLIKCIQQRNHTIVRLMQRLTMIQRAFILKGDANIKPLTRAKLAEDLGVHESTISRAVSNKAVQLPSGRIIPMAKFFDRSLHIRTVLRQIVAQENKPLTDTQLVRELNERGFSIARRTVAKYRSMEGILPAHMRVQMKQHHAQP